MNANCVIFMTKHQNQFSHGLTDHQFVVMTITPVQSKMLVKMDTVWVPNTAVKYPIHSPVVYRVLNVLVMERVGIS
jgi:hypothetical protein